MFYVVNPTRDLNRFHGKSFGHFILSMPLPYFPSLFDSFICVTFSLSLSSINTCEHIIQTYFQIDVRFFFLERPFPGQNQYKWMARNCTSYALNERSFNCPIASKSVHIQWPWRRRSLFTGKCFFFLWKINEIDVTAWKEEGRERDNRSEGLRLRVAIN